MKGGEQITTNLEMEELTRFSDWQNIKRKGKDDVRISNMGNSGVGVIPLIQKRKKERWTVSRGWWKISWKVTKQFGQCQRIWEEHWGGSQVPSLSTCVTLAANVNHPKLQLFPSSEQVELDDFYSFPSSRHYNSNVITLYFPNQQYRKSKVIFLDMGGSFRSKARECSSILLSRALPVKKDTTGALHTCNLT